MRTYHSPSRELAALHTRRRILQAARTELLGSGPQGMTMTSLARAAGVSPQTVYNSLGNKAAVVKAVYDVLLAGDDEPIPMNDRPELRAVLRAPSAPDMLRAYAAFATMLFARIGPLIGVLLADGPAGDEDLRTFLRTIDSERRIGNTGVVRHVDQRFGLPAGLTVERAVDHVWALTGPELGDRLVRKCGWRLEEYQAWLGDQLVAGLSGGWWRVGGSLPE